MGIIESIRLALRALSANKLRASLTMLGIMIGVGAVIGMIAVGTGAQAEVTSQIQSVGSNMLFISPGSVRQTGSRFQVTTGVLTYEDALAIRAADYLPVTAVAPEAGTNARIAARGVTREARLIGTTHEYQQIRNARLSKGEFFNQEHIDFQSLVVVLGANVAWDLFEGEDPIDQTIRISVGERPGVNFRVIGVMEERRGSPMLSPDEQIFVPITTMQQRVYIQRTTRGEHNVSSINVQVVDESRLDETVDALGALLRDRHRVEEDDFTITTQADVLELAGQIMGIMTVLLGSIAGISLVVGGIGIMNIMLVSVTERTREIGIRKAVGARRKDIMVQFLIEAMTVSVFGGGMGILLGSLLAHVVSLIDTGGGNYLNTVVTPDAVLLAVGVSAAIGLFFGIYPAMRAARMNPIEALRYE